MRYRAARLLWPSAGCGGRPQQCISLRGHRSCVANPKKEQSVVATRSVTFKFWVRTCVRLWPPRQPGTRCCAGDSALCHRSPRTFSGSIAFRVAEGQMTAAPLQASGTDRSWRPSSPTRCERFTFSACRWRLSSIVMLKDCLPTHDASVRRQHERAFIVFIETYKRPRPRIFLFLFCASASTTLRWERGC